MLVQQMLNSRAPTNPTRECLPLVIQLMPYYAQHNELAILRELHAKIGDPEKLLHQRMMIDAIVREQWAVRSSCSMSHLSAGDASLQQTVSQQQQQLLYSASSFRQQLAASRQQQQQCLNLAERGSRKRGAEEEEVIIVDEQISAAVSAVEGRHSGLPSRGSGSRAAKDQQQANDSLAERRENFLREASTLYNNKYRMLSRSVYEFYIKRLKITQNLDPRLLLKKDLEIRNKFELALFMEEGMPVERLVERGKENRKLVAIEEVFDVVNAFHERSGHGKRMAIYDAIKREYANITLNCVLLYMAGCQGCYSTGGDPAQQVDNRRSNQFNDDMQQLKSRCSPIEKTVESRAAKLGLDEIDYSEHFLIGEDEIRCRHCHFVYFHKSRQRPRHSLRSHLRNYHRKLFNQMLEQNGEDGADMLMEA